MMKYDVQGMKKAKKRGAEYLYIDIRTGRIFNVNYLYHYRDYPLSDCVWVTIEEYEFITSKNRKPPVTCADLYDKVRWNKKGQIWIEDENKKKHKLN